LGQQQLLLIVLSVIIIGIAIVIALTLIEENQVESNKDGLYADNMNIAGLAQQYYIRLKALGGGEFSFVGFNIPAGLQETGNGYYTITEATVEKVIITGKGKVQDGDGNVYSVVTQATANDITTVSVTKVSP
jgi:type II secretory pathway pseudopilin PulG